MKCLNPSQELVSFDGTPLLDDKQIPLTLKDVLLAYLVNAHHMNLGADGEAKAYELGVLIAQGKKTVELSQAQYDMLKGICDRLGKVKVPNGTGEVALFGIVVTQQVKKIIDEAESA